MPFTVITELIKIILVVSFVYIFVLVLLASQQYFALCFSQRFLLVLNLISVHVSFISICS